MQKDTHAPDKRLANGVQSPRSRPTLTSTALIKLRLVHTLLNTKLGPRACCAHERERLAAGTRERDALEHWGARRVRVHDAVKLEAALPRHQVYRARAVLHRHQVSIRA